MTSVSESIDSVNCLCFCYIMNRSTFDIPGMDCPSEERIIRMQLSEIRTIEYLYFDLEGRKLDVYHTGDASPIDKKLATLGFGSKFKETTASELPLEAKSDRTDRKLLWWALGINFIFFIIESVSGFLSSSLGLIADGMDMLADAFVYTMALMAISAGYAAARKRTAGVSGILQLVLAFWGFGEAVRRYLNPESIPDFPVMMSVAGLALLANVATLLLLNRSQSQGEHMKASLIFTSNDVIANVGVIVAGGLVYLTSSALPDLIAGVIVFALILRGAIRIMNLAR